MTFALVAASSVLAVLLTLGWAREFRLRRALQSLLARVFDHWRNAHETKPDRDRPHPAATATDSDRMQ
jgi:hypothetical protein